MTLAEIVRKWLKENHPHYTFLQDGSAPEIICGCNYVLYAAFMLSYPNEVSVWNGKSPHRRIIYASDPQFFKKLAKCLNCPNANRLEEA